ncbi:lycopene cyclase family protein [Saccharomonospora sp. NPDC046836]|uniref:lycopene cyclase family protein n=1 Tax=Saccharomonospora sp. NPDC046836 TaxID=3156921 RepID=UPI0033FF359C
MVDVAVLGGGPAGRAMAAACVREGLATALVDPAPERRWRQTYALWRDELPALPAGAIAAAPATVLAGGRALDREYLVLDNAGLRRWLADDRVEVRSGTAVDIAHGPHGSLIRLADDSRIAAHVVVDARGTPPGHGAAQTAFGLVLPAGQAAPLVPAGTAVFMDWRDAPAVDPSFLYAVPLAADRVLVEETSLARKPALPRSILAARLRQRLAAAGIATDGLPEEHVHIRLDTPLPRPGRTVPFGARAGLVHPATGFSVAASLGLAPRVATALSTELTHGPGRAASAARHVLWPPRAVAVHTLRRQALRSLSSIPGCEQPYFFDLFFAMAPRHQRAFTSGREDLTGLLGAMTALFCATPWRLRPALFR